MFITYKIERYKKNDDGSFGTNPYIEINAYNKRVLLGLGTKKDTFSFSVNNNYNKYFNGFSVYDIGDRVKIYAKVNSSLIVNSDLVIDGVIDSISENMAESNSIVITGVNRTEQFLEGLAIVSTETAQTPNSILQAAINFHNSQNQNFPITWNVNNPITSTVAGKKRDGSDFPVYLAHEFYKSMNIIFERYSSDEYTQDGNYYYYLEENTLNWAKRMNDTTGILNESDCETISVNNNTQNVVNSLVIYCGSTPKGVGIKTYAFNDSSKAKNGTKWKFVTSTNSISTSIMQNEVDVNSSSFNVDTDGWFPLSYPYEPTWLGSNVVTDAEYNEAVRLESANRGKARGVAYLNKIKDKLVKAQVTLPFSTDYTLGQLISCNFTKYGLNNYPLRVQEIQYTDLSVILKLSEDELN